MPVHSNYNSTTEKTLQFIKLANEFEHWMNSNNQFNQSDMELLLAWLDKDENPRGVENYEDFLALAQEVAASGFKTAIDVPISEEDFANRKIVNYFESWLKKSNQPLMRSSDYLLVWLDKGDGSRHITSYQHFLQLAQTLVNRGYKASIDLPISEADFKQIYDIERPTIFLEIVKKFLVDAITVARNRSLADGLLFKLHRVTGGGSDLESCNLLKSLVAEECKKTAKAASDSEDCVEGTFGQTMTAAMLLIQNIYDKLKEVQLLDILHNDDPLNQFCYHMAHYFSKKAVDALTPSFVSRMSTHLKFTATQEKEELILRALKECALDGHSNYPENRRKRVLESIERLMQKIISVCEEHNSRMSPPVSIGFFSIVNVGIPPLGHNVGFLENCLLEAKKEISSDTADTILAI